MKILLAMDNSPTGAEALRLVCELYRNRSVSLVVLHVVPRHRIRTRRGPVLIECLDLGSERIAGTTILAHAVKTLREAEIGPDIVTQIDVGDPSTSILSAVEANRADMLVLGYQGISRVQGFLLGSVSTRVVTQCRCSVIVAHPKACAVENDVDRREQAQR